MMDNQQITNKEEATSNDFVKICHFCSRVFSSGKALGGHIRIHIHPPNNRRLSSPAHRLFANNHQLGMKNPVCRICGKNFPSMKSLFGHMRCHPDRGWKGIDPPLKMNSSISSSEVDDDHAEVESSEKDFSSVDLAASLKKWPVTAKRGRKAVSAGMASSLQLSSSDDDDRVRHAVKFLMMLSRGDYVVGKRPKSDDQSDEVNHVVESKKPAIDQNNGEDIIDYKVMFMIKNKRVLDFDLNQMVESEDNDVL